MKMTTENEWVKRPGVIRALVSFATPRTPSQVERRLGMKKLKMRPFVEKGLLRPLNVTAPKGRLFTTTAKARKLLGLPSSKRGIGKNWHLIGWVMASPRQKAVILKTVDSLKRTSEEIRERASKLNGRLSRTSTKGILKDLVDKGLANTELTETKRYYRISERGKSVAEDVDWILGNKN